MKLFLLEDFLQTGLALVIEKVKLRG